MSVKLNLSHEWCKFYNKYSLRCADCFEQAKAQKKPIGYCSLIGQEPIVIR